MSLPNRKLTPGLIAFILALSVVVLGTVAATSARAADAQKPAAAGMAKDQELSTWAGSWEGTSGPADKTTPAELVWTWSIEGQWLEGHFTVWGDQDKKTVVVHERLFIRPSGAPGEYKTAALSKTGEIQTGTAIVKGSNMEWQWTSDNGSKETATLNYPANGKLHYVGTVTDTKGGTTSLDFMLTKSAKK